MLAKDRLLDLVENFILFDDSRTGGTRKIVARNHQVLGVNNAVASVVRQEELKKQYPPEVRLRYRVAEVERSLHGSTEAEFSDEWEDRKATTAERHAQEDGERETAHVPADQPPKRERHVRKLPLVERAHPDLGLLGVFWHTQGSGKSYSMAFFAEKVRRVVQGNFTFVVMTDRDDLDNQLFRTFVGCGVVGEKTPRAGSGSRTAGPAASRIRASYSP